MKRVLALALAAAVLCFAVALWLVSPLVLLGIALLIATCGAYILWRATGMIAAQHTNAAEHAAWILAQPRVDAAREIKEFADDEG